MWVVIMTVMLLVRPALDAAPATAEAGFDDAIAAVLVFAGGKLLVSSWLGLPPLVSVAVIAVCIGLSVVVSVRANRRDRVVTLASPAASRPPASWMSAASVA